MPYNVVRISTVCSPACSAPYPRKHQGGMRICFHLMTTCGEAICIMKQFAGMCVMVVIFIEAASYIRELGIIIMQTANHFVFFKIRCTIKLCFGSV